VAASTAAPEPPLVDEAEVVVVGAGPAGCACAARLADRGHEVLLVDQSVFPRDKACGDGLSTLAMTHLERLGLEHVLTVAHPISGLRGNFEYRRHKVVRYDPPPGRSFPACCVPRLTLDAALLTAARERGARFSVARAQAPVLADGRLPRLDVSRDGQAAAIAARFVVAADGATSRMRRELGVARPEHGLSAYGMRQYFTTGRALDPFFDVYVPVEFEGFDFAGYGWVFPVGERRANIGVGHFRGPGIGDAPPIPHVFDLFVASLESKARERLGDLVREGRPIGSPVGMGFGRGRCRVGDVFFVGDAARTTDPISGEGIAYALEGGTIVADLVHATAIRGRRRGDAGDLLARRFPRLGQNMSTVVRLSVLAMNAGSQEATAGRREDSMPIARRIVTALDPFDPSWTRTAVARLVARADPESLTALEEVNVRALDLAETTYPFFREALARQLVARGGPLPAAGVLLAARACGGDVDEDLRALAVAVTLTFTVQGALIEVVDRPRTATAKLHNAGILLYTDFAVSRAWSALRDFEPEAVRELARAGVEACKGTLMAQRDRYDVAQPVDRHADVSDRIYGNAGAVAFGLAAELAGASAATVATMRDAGRLLARAHQIATEIRELVEGDEPSLKRPALDASLGFYGLPVLRAAGDATVRRLLVRGVTAADAGELVDAIRAAGGIDAAVDECRAAVVRASDACARLELPRPELVAALGDLAVERATGAS